MLLYTIVALSASAITLTSAAPQPSPESVGWRVTDAADATVSATLQLCEEADCTSCHAFDLTSAPTQTCNVATPPVSITLSYNISSPNGNDLPFNVFVGPAGCTVWTTARDVNVCYNLEPGARPFEDYFIIPK